MKLLVSWDIFQDDINEIRKEFGIPANGFKSGKDLKDWQDDLCKKSDEFFKTKNYKNQKINC